MTKEQIEARIKTLNNTLVEERLRLADMHLAYAQQPSDQVLVANIALSTHSVQQIASGISQLEAALYSFR